MAPDPPDIQDGQAELAQLRQTQERLARSEERYRRMVEMANEGIWAVDHEERTTFVNQRMADMLGYTTQEMLGRTVASFLPPEELADYQARLALRGAGQGGRYERRLRRRDGGLICALISSTPLLDPQGGLAGSFAMLTDITERKPAEERIQRLNEGLEGQVAERTASLAATVAALELEVARHQQARQELLASNQRYSTLLEHTLQGVAILAGDPAHFAYVNPRMSEIFGYSAQEFGDLGPEEMWKLVHPGDREMVRQRALTRLAGQEPPPRYEFRIVRKDGQVRWVEVFSAPTEHQGRPASQIAYIDISERKRAEEALRQSEERFSTAFRAIPVPAAITERESGRFVEVNDALVRATGLTRPEVVGRSGHELGLWPQPRERQRVIDLLVSGQRSAEVTLRLPGLPQPLRRGVFSIEEISIQGQPYILTIFQDLTEQMAAEEALRQSEERYRLISDNARDVVVLRDLDLRGLYVSPSVRRVLGYEPPEFLGLSLPELLHPDDAQRSAGQALERLRQCQENVYLQSRVRRKDGSYVWLEILAGPFRDGQGRVVGYQASSRDISERRRAEDALLHLAAGVAHNFNNVLMASLSNAQAAQGLLSHGQADPERLGELLENVVQATLGGRDVVHRLSRFVSGRQEQTTSPEVVDLGQLLAALPGLMQGMTAPGRVRLELRAEDGLLVRGAAGELMEVFLNLAKNAVEAMPQGGLLEVSARPQGKLALVEFRDHGLGADQATLARFFEPFFSTKGAQGQGLGLSVSLAIARSHGGDLCAQSQPGQGATLGLRLPLALEPPPCPDPLPRADRTGPLKVLLVEDEGLVAMGMTLSLESAGHQVLHVVTTAGALAIMEQFRPHLAICDLGLPDATGWEVCARLERQARDLGLGRLPLVVLSGWGREQLGALPPGAPQPFAYLQKPVERARLLEVIAQAGQQAAS